MIYPPCTRASSSVTRLCQPRLSHLISEGFVCFKIRTTATGGQQARQQQAGWPGMAGGASPSPCAPREEQIQELIEEAFLHRSHRTCSLLHVFPSAIYWHFFPLTFPNPSPDTEHSPPRHQPENCGSGGKADSTQGTIPVLSAAFARGCLAFHS